MGWFDTVLGLTSVALDVATLSRIQKMSELCMFRLKAGIGKYG